MRKLIKTVTADFSERQLKECSAFTIAWHLARLGFKAKLLEEFEAPLMAMTGELFQVGAAWLWVPGGKCIAFGHPEWPPVRLSQEIWEEVPDPEFVLSMYLPAPPMPMTVAAFHKWLNSQLCDSHGAGARTDQIGISVEVGHSGDRVEPIVRWAVGRLRDPASPKAGEPGFARNQADARDRAKLRELLLKYPEEVPQEPSR